MLTLEQFRKTSTFKNLVPYVRKTIINVGKTYPDTIFHEDIPKYFTNTEISKYVEIINKGSYIELETIKQDKKMELLLSKLSTYNYSLSYNTKDLFQIKKFTIRQSELKPEYLYHKSNVPPEIIMKEGLKPHYSLGIYSHPSLVFLSTDKHKWFGDYEYKIKTEQQLYIDTNLDWRCLDKRGYLFVMNNINPENIVEFKKLVQ